MKTMKIGIADYDQMKERTLAIARGDYKPTEGEPTVWFTSLESFAKVLSQRNRELLALVGSQRGDLDASALVSECEIGESQAKKPAQEFDPADSGEAILGPVPPDDPT